MAEWDRLDEQLKELGESTARFVEDPWDPAIVRRLGARRRHRRWLAGVAAAVVVMISGGTGVYVLTNQDQTPPPPSPVGIPSESAHTGLVGEPSIEPSGRARLLPTPSARRERPRSVPTQHPTGTPSTPDPAGESPEPTITESPSEPVDTPPPPPAATSSQPEPPPVTEPQEVDPPSQPSELGTG